MQRIKMKKKDYAAWVDFWECELAEAPQETIRRLRWAFSELDEPDLLAMAAKHPDTARAMRYCRRRIAYNRRMMRKR